MPRYHFDLIDQGVPFKDDEGVEFIDRDTMQEAAMRAAGAMISEKTDFPRQPWKMVIRDEQRIVVTLTFAAA